MDLPPRVQEPAEQQQSPHDHQSWGPVAARPATTTELTRQLRLSPAAVSAYLSRLKAAELVEPHRSGKRVYYRLNGAGESLLGIFDELA